MNRLKVKRWEKKYKQYKRKVGHLYKTGFKVKASTKCNNKCCGEKPINTSRISNYYKCKLESRDLNHMRQGLK